MLCEAGADAAAGEGGAVVVPSVNEPGSMPGLPRRRRQATSLPRWRQRGSSDQPTISRVQQSIAAFK
jgi:hypothetical protein